MATSLSVIFVSLLLSPCSGASTIKHIPFSNDEEVRSKSFDLICPEKQFTCANLKCIPDEKVCDGKNDCLDDSDERVCTQGLCTKSSCPYGCVSNLEFNFHYCPCEKGFVNDGQFVNTCRDINECETNLRFRCSQSCLNTNGYYNCICHDGYKSSQDTLGKCISESREVYLLYSAPSGIYALKIDTGEKKLVVPTYEKVTAIDFDQGEMIYWVANYKNILRSYMVGALNGRVTEGSPQFVFRTDSLVGDITSIAIDWLAGNIYWTMGKAGLIMVSKVDGRYPKKVVIGQFSPSFLNVNPRTGWMHWVNYGNSLRRAQMNGEAAITLHYYERMQVSIEAINMKQLMLIDHMADDLIYWIGGNNTLCSGIVENKIDNHLKLISDFSCIWGDIFEDFIYCLPRIESDVIKYNRFKNSTTILKGLRPTVIRIFQAHRLPNNRGLSEVCIDGTCPYLCLHTPRGSNCSCPSEGCPESQDPVGPPPPVCSCPQGGGCIWRSTKCRKGDSDPLQIHTEDDDSIQVTDEGSLLAYALLVIFILVALGITLSFFKRNPSS